MDREYWSNVSFFEENGEYRVNSPVSCPHCGKGHLSVYPNSCIKIREKSSLDELHKQKFEREFEFEHEVDLDLTNDWGLFSLYLQCELCHNVTQCSGSYKGDMGYKQHVLGEEEVYYYRLTPDYFSPGLNIINIPDSVSDSTRENIKLSFFLFWINKSACASQIRVSLEKLMDERKVKKFPGLTRKRSKKLYLHKRIEIFGAMNQNKFSEEAEKLTAIKWIGNEGAHTETTKASVLDAYLLLESVLENIFQNKKQELSKITAEINRSKGSRKTMKEGN